MLLILIPKIVFLGVIPGYIGIPQLVNIGKYSQRRNIFVLIDHVIINLKQQQHNLIKILLLLHSR
jgi:hypothetical protein